jgi:hypothetical protein
VEAGKGDHLVEGALELAHVRAQVLGDQEGDVVVDQHAQGFGLLLEDGDAHLELGRLDLHRQAPVEARDQAVFQALDVLGVGVAGDDDLLACASVSALKAWKNSSWVRFLLLKNWMSSMISMSRER